MVMKHSKQSRELAGALAEDQKRQAVDAAKKRAVAQQVDYDTFKKMVSVAHLKPLQAPSATCAGPLIPAWGLDPTGVFASAATTSSLDVICSTTAAKASVSNSRKGSMEVEQHIPRNSQEFQREWRRNCPTAADKYRLLKACGPEGMAQIFKVEITGDLLGQVLMVLAQQWRDAVQNAVDNSGSSSSSTQPPAAAATPSAQGPNGSSQQQHQHQQEALFVMNLLHELTGTGRFDLNARLMGSKAKQAAEQLCNDLEAALQQETVHSNGNSSDGKLLVKTAAGSSACSNGASRCGVHANTGSISISRTGAPQQGKENAIVAGTGVEQQLSSLDLDGSSQKTQQHHQQEHCSLTEAVEPLAYVRKRLQL